MSNFEITQTLRKSGMKFTPFIVSDKKEYDDIIKTTINIVKSLQKVNRV